MPSEKSLRLSLAARHQVPWHRRHREVGPRPGVEKVELFRDAKRPKSVSN